MIQKRDKSQTVDDVCNTYEQHVLMSVLLKKPATNQ